MFKGDEMKVEVRNPNPDELIPGRNWGTTTEIGLTLEELQGAESTILPHTAGDEEIGLILKDGRAVIVNSIDFDF
jgi:hypothetical protein